MKKALIVGINDYDNISPLKGCIKDALAIKDVLETNGDGSPNFEVKLLISSDAPIKKAALVKSIIDLFNNNGGVSLFYFSGHGLVKTTGGYIVTTDGVENDEGVSMEDILILANQSSAKDKIVLLDCCHSGSFGESGHTKKSEAILSEGLSVLTASHGTESAIEINGQGIFTTLVVEALRGGSADLRGNITPGSIYAYVDQALGAWDQRPIFKTNVTRFTSIRTVNPRVPIEILRDLPKYFVNPHDEHQLDPSYEDSIPGFDPTKAQIFKNFQKLVSVGVVMSVGEDHMYYAAVNSKSCKLTAIGFLYWKLANLKRL